MTETVDLFTALSSLPRTNRHGVCTSKGKGFATRARRYGAFQTHDVFRSNARRSGRAAVARSRPDQLRRAQEVMPSPDECLVTAGRPAVLVFPDERLVVARLFEV